MKHRVLNACVLASMALAMLMTTSGCIFPGHGDDRNSGRVERRDNDRHDERRDNDRRDEGRR